MLFRSDTSGRGRIPDKEAALCLLHDLLQLEPYQPKPRASGDRSWPAPGEAPAPVPLPPLVPLPEAVERRIRKQLQAMRRR